MTYLTKRLTAYRPFTRYSFSYRAAMALLVTLLSISPLSHAFDHSQWDALAKQHVHLSADGFTSEVDYQGFADDRAALKAYLESLSEVSWQEFEQWSKPEQLSFLINAYNSWTVELIVRNWPDIESIRDLGNLLSSPWKKEFIPLLGETRSLDDIEHGLIREDGRFNEPRIHFAVNCASIGCPPLRAEAFVADQLEQQLEQQTRWFLSDRSRNRVSKDGLEVSSIFNWYGNDFERGWVGYQRLEDFFLKYADDLDIPAAQRKALQQEKLDIDYLDYDWKLNVKR
ncbi:DUF547 domain-containing protein [Bacterioplanoides sp.]|uniref:DUF547 domain-containing protein n=1 Tax=Bacterioplanoides sp. TaxID=2066072 RepID=UPI003B00C990